MDEEEEKKEQLWGTISSDKDSRKKKKISEAGSTTPPAGTKLVRWRPHGYLLDDSQSLVLVCWLDRSILYIPFTASFKSMVH
jgi:hypothetical protein